MNSSKTVRINKFDNLRGIAILLIVIGHYVEFTNTPNMVFLHNLLYLVHLPIFFFCSGYFSKIGPDEPAKAFKRLFIPFILFCILYWLFQKFYLMENPHILFINPGYGLWFLISLFIMKMSLPIIDKLRYPLITSLVLAILIGFIDCRVLGISRTFAYLPFFILGFYFKDYKSIMANKHAKISSYLSDKKIILIILILTLTSLILIAYNVPFEWIRYKKPYECGLEILVRIIAIAFGFMFVLCINSMMTNKEILFTKFGKNSLSVYLLHIFTVVVFTGFLNEMFSGNEASFLAAVLISSFAVVYILSRDIVNDSLNKLFDAIFKCLCH